MLGLFEISCRPAWFRLYFGLVIDGDERNLLPSIYISEIREHMLVSNKGHLSKHDTLTQCWANVGPPSSMLHGVSDYIDCLHEFAQWAIVCLKQFTVAHCVACCHWKVCNSCLIKTVQRCSPCGVLLLKKVYSMSILLLIPRLTLETPTDIISMLTHLIRLKLCFGISRSHCKEVKIIPIWLIWG